ncbi:MAG: thiamine phosphate synthase [Opitutaceae bacterium]|nr:thiamine phosphate synthase [Opitutaceae bacterium]
MLDHVAAALDGGVSVVQHRDSTPGKRRLYETARALRELTRARGVPLIINDHLDLALAVEADGAHVGQGDLPVAAARRVLGPGRLLGLSVTNELEFNAAELALVDYLGVGPIYPTGSKADAAPAAGLPFLTVIAARSPRPVVAIGGITVERARDIFAAGAAGVAVIAALSQASDPAAAARALRAACGR